jgi:hypothetical protein
MLQFLKHNHDKYQHSPSCSSSNTTTKQENASLFLKFLSIIFLNIAEEQEQENYSISLDEDMKKELNSEFTELILQVFQTLDCEPVCFLLGLFYFENYVKITQEFDIEDYQEIYLCCLMLASKMLEDRYWSTKKYSEILQVEDYKYFIQTESSILNALNFELHVSKEDLDSYVQSHR